MHGTTAVRQQLDAPSTRNEDLSEKSMSGRIDAAAAAMDKMFDFSEWG